MEDKIFDEKEIGEHNDVLEGAKALKESLKLDNIDTAILLLIQSDVDQLRFYNTK